jgi:hypothetical protein
MKTPSPFPTLLLAICRWITQSPLLATSIL